jgi:hypothetical protein
MNVFEENRSLREEVADLRADLAAAEARLQQLHAPRLPLTDDEPSRFSEVAFFYPEETQVHRALTRKRRGYGRREARRR